MRRARVNYLMGILAEEGLDNSMFDSILHGINEIGFGKGPLDERMLTYIEKTLRRRERDRRVRRWEVSAG